MSARVGTAHEAASDATCAHLLSQGRTGRKCLRRRRAVPHPASVGASGTDDLLEVQELVRLSDGQRWYFLPACLRHCPCDKLSPQSRRLRMSHASRQRTSARDLSVREVRGSVGLQAPVLGQFREQLTPSNAAAGKSILPHPQPDRCRSHTFSAVYCGSATAEGPALRVGVGPREEA